MLEADEQSKKALRKERGVAGKLQERARNCLSGGCLDQGAYIQFGSDHRRTTCTKLYSMPTL